MSASGNHPLVSTNVPKSKFSDINFKVGDDGTSFYNFENRYDNFLLVQEAVEKMQQNQNKKSKGSQDEKHK
jgi:hypothetical protein